MFLNYINSMAFLKKINFFFTVFLETVKLHSPKQLPKFILIDLRMIFLNLHQAIFLLSEAQNLQPNGLGKLKKSLGKYLILLPILLKKPVCQFLSLLMIARLSCCAGVLESQ